MSTFSDQRTEWSYSIILAKSYQWGKPMWTEENQEFLTLYSDNTADWSERSHGEITLLKIVLLNAEKNTREEKKISPMQCTFCCHPF